MKNNPWIKTAALWFIASFFTVFAILRLTDGKKIIAEEGTGNEEQLVFEEMLKSENERAERNEGKVIVLKSSFADMMNENKTLTVTEEKKAGTKEAAPDAAENSETEPKKEKSETTAMVTVERLPEKEENAAAPAGGKDEIKDEETRVKETTVQETTVQETTVQETTSGIPETAAPEPQAETVKCTFHSNINQSGRWSAGDDDLFTLEIYGTGSGEAFSMEYFSYDTEKIDALYESYPETDPVHAAEISEKFGTNGSVISYRCTDGNEISYINVLPQDRIITIEGSEEAGMRFYTGDGYNEEVLINYERAVSGMTLEGDEIVLK